MRHAIETGARAWRRALEEGSTARGFTVVLLTALAVHAAYALIYILRFDPPPLPGFGAELGSVATHLYSGRGFASPYAPDTPTAMFAPAVPALWAGLMHLVPGGPAGPIQEAIIAVQTLPSALTAAVTWLIARSLRSRMDALPSAFPSVIAAAACVWPESIVRVTQCWYYVWQSCGVALLLLTAMRFADRPDVGRGLALGGVAGAIALVNPTPLPLFAVALLGPCLARRLAPRVLGAALASGVLSLAIAAPWLVRNALVFDAFVPLRSNYGIELRQGNNPRGSIRQSIDSLNPTLVPEERERYLTLGEVEYGRRARDAALAYMRAHPVETAVRIAQRAYVSWCTDLFDFWPWSEDSRWWKGRWRRVILQATTIASALLSLAIVLWGLATGRLRGLPHATLFAGVFLLLPLPYYFTSANDYYMQSVRPWLALLAGVALLRRDGAVRYEELG